MSPTRRCVVTRSRTAASASPVSKTSVAPAEASSTTLESFSDASETARSGETTRTVHPPTANRSPVRSSVRCAVRRRASRAAVSGVASAPAAKLTAPTPTTPCRPARPPAWSACRCVMTTRSSRLTPARARASRRVAGSGPVSTSTAWAPSRSSSASPCPTSSMSRLGPRVDGGPRATATHAARATTPRRRASRMRGAGQATHSAPAAASATTRAPRAEPPSGTAAYGRSASHPEALTHIAAKAPATSSSALPSAGHTSAAPSPASPSARASDTSGSATTLATGATRDIV